MSSYVQIKRSPNLVDITLLNDPFTISVFLSKFTTWLSDGDISPHIKHLRIDCRRRTARLIKLLRVVKTTMQDALGALTPDTKDHISMNHAFDTHIFLGETLPTDLRDIHWITWPPPDDLSIDSLPLEDHHSYLGVSQCVFTYYVVCICSSFFYFTECTQVRTNRHARCHCSRHWRNFVILATCSALDTPYCKGTEVASSISPSLYFLAVPLTL